MITLFMGTYKHTVDAKGRVSMPAKFRTGEEGEGFFVTRGLDGCLFVYSREEWTKFFDKLSELPSTTNKMARDVLRYFTANVHECDVDKLGRINIPQNLREMAGLVKDVTIIGARNRMEIWDTATWETYQAEQISEEMVLESMDSLGMQF